MSRVHDGPRMLALVMATGLAVGVWGHDLEENPGRSPLGEAVALTMPATQAATAPERQQASAPATQPATQATRPARKERLVGWLELSGSLPDSPPPLAWISEDEQQPTVRGLVTQLERVAEDSKYVGLVLYLHDPTLEPSQIVELTAAIQRVQAAGKKVVAFAEAYDLGGYLLACAADKLLLQDRGVLMLVPLEMEELYLAGMLDKIGVKADLIQIGKYKGAQEPLTRTQPSEEWSQNIEGLLDDLYGQLVGIVAERRKLAATAAEEAIAESWAMSDRQYVERGLVDGLSDRSLTAATGELFGSDFQWDQEMLGRRERHQPTNPFSVFQKMLAGSKQRITRPSIMLVRASGVITMGESQVSGDGMFGSDSIGSQTMAEVLAEARKDENVKGVLIRIDSPGGSAVASEAIWQSMRQTAKAKPVYVSVASMAASGGYYLACAADRVYVTDASIVGSIGVVGGKLVLGGLYDKLGLHVQRRWRGGIGDIFNSVAPFTQEQRAALMTSMTRTYETFLDRVKTGRGERLADPAAVAEGRLFTGRQAVANGMADQTGGLEVALADLAEQLGLKEGTYGIVQRPEPLSLPEFLETVFGASSGATGQASGLPGTSGAGLWAEARQVLGPRVWAGARRALEGMMLLRAEPVLTLLPTVISIR